MREAASKIDLYHPFQFLKECIRLGAGGMQADLSRLTEAEAETLREQSRETGRFIEAIIRLPKGAAELNRFEHDVRIARRAGAAVARTTIISGRRYEQFNTYADFRKAEQIGEASIRTTIPVIERHGLTLAIENHKDQRNEERVRFLRRIDSEFVGACVDTGNSIALLEDPIETVKAFTPWAKTVHLKDQAVQRTTDGFLLGDITLGAGCLDLRAMVKALQAAKPGIRFSLELITRDPLLVPCLTRKYMSSFDQLPAADLARTLRMVEMHSQQNLPKLSDLPPEKQVQIEESNIVGSLRYATDQLGLVVQEG